MVTKLARGALPVVILLALTGLAGLAGARIYAEGPLLPLLLGAAAASILLSTLLRPLPNWTVAPVSMLALGGYTLLAVQLTMRGDADATLMSAYLDAARNALPRLLTAAVPIEAAPDTVLVPIVAVWLAGLLGAELAGRGGRLLFGALPPTVAYAAALVLAGPNAQPALWQPLAYAAVCAVGLALTARQRTDAPVLTGDQPSPAKDRVFQLRAIGGAAAGLAAMLAVAVAAGPLVFGGVAKEPHDPRTAVVPPREDALDANPLIRISGWAAQPTQHLLDAELPADMPIRLAVLSEYDGVTWKVGADYRNAGKVLPSVTGPATTGKSSVVKQSYTVAELDGGLVPAVSTPNRIDNLRVAFDSRSGTLFKADRLATGQKYQVESVYTKPDVNLLSVADVPSGDAYARYLSVGSTLPTDLVNMANHITENNPGAYAKAYALQGFLAEHYKFNPTAASGHALPNLQFFLTKTVAEGGRQGTSEQFAASFAVLGRMMGLPTRVVVGFKGRSGKHPVLASDATAWPEVLFTGVGWVSFDPMPQDQNTKPLEDDYTPPPPTKTPSVPPSQVTQSPLASTAAPATGVGSAAEPVLTAPVLLMLSGVLLFGLLVVGALVVGLLRRSRTGRRLRSGTPSERVLGAWLEVRDAIRLAGHTPPPHLTASEIALYASLIPVRRRSARHGEPLPALGPLAELVNVVGFAPGLLGEAEARLAVEQAVAYVRELRGRRSLFNRVAWSLSIRPLLWKPSRPVVAEPGMSHATPHA
ncbi:hypothetical protein Lfu02_53760 [Longispora fulva]|uniref:Transglutaminase-like putative cysteine protease n=1 Tax=Longispora fulva TaxID=619741 RepID=A0A8J7KZC3_9ACTN|nr:transglutaminase domain-containing protein [Longispora fulva]MBG6140732.1 transglutaminase-like putative cysteine protease [Longispora fulva]GIG61004.1 hypothetical protein Lfu02_53760 [Longispora fulva]